MNTQLYRKVEETMRRYDMVKRGDRVLVGVSGGPDSVFLLKALLYLRDKLSYNISVANLDHGIRGRASRLDSRFVKDMAKKYHVTYFHKRLKIKKSVSSPNLSTEEFLRQERYDFFQEAARRTKSNVLATGHTLDDQAETVLMRVIKGSTIKGLAGIQPLGKNNGIRVMRPLIDIEKAEIIVFLEKNKIRHRVDHTNFDEKYLRNKIRRRVLPYLLRYNPKLKRSLSLMAASLREDREFIEEEKKKKSLIDKKNDSVTIRLKDIVVQPKTLQREILRDALLLSGASVKKLTYRHWIDMNDFLRYKRKGQSLDLPGGVIMRRNEKTISLKLRNAL